MNESNLMRSIMAAVSTPATRVFRNNVGTGWTGSKIIRNPNGSITIHDPRPLNAGLCKGSSDLIGWRSVGITPDMVGKRVAVFLAIETKGPRAKTYDEQTNFIDRVKIAGGLAGIARSIDDAQTITNQL